MIKSKSSLATLAGAALLAVGLFISIPLARARARTGHHRMNQLTAAQKKAGWQLLFDGKTTRGWRGFGKKTFPKHGWDIEDGCLHHLPHGGGGSIITTKTYSNFDLRFDWKIARGGNSGVKYFIIESRGAPIGHEYQIIDDQRHPDALRGTKYQTGAFYDVFPATNKVLHPAGRFNHSRILVRGNHVEHWLNGRRILEYQLGSPRVLAAVAKSKFKHIAGFGTKIRGHILLQDHGDEVWFRNLRIRDLSRGHGHGRKRSPR